MHLTERLSPSLRRWRALSALLCALAWALHGCTATTTAPVQGQSREAVVQAHGTPLAAYDVAGKSHWFYNRGTEKSARDLLVFNADGTLEETRPAWTRQVFASISAGKTRSLDLLQQLGPPLRQGRESSSSLLGLASEDKASSETTTVYWLYAFKEYGEFFNVNIRLDDAGTVTSVLIHKDPVTNRVNP